MTTTQIAEIDTVSPDIVTLIGRFSRVQALTYQEHCGENDRPIMQMQELAIQILNNPGFCMKALRAKALVVLEFTEENSDGDLAHESARALAQAVLAFLDD